MRYFRVEPFQNIVFSSATEKCSYCTVTSLGLASYYNFHTKEFIDDELSITFIHSNTGLLEERSYRKLEDLADGFAPDEIFMWEIIEELTEEDFYAKLDAVLCMEELTS